MTPNPMNNAQPPVAPSAMPLVALILGVLGFCIPILFPVAIILAIVSLVKGSEPAYAARKTLAIITLALGLIYIPIVGILAAIAIPNFIRFQARSKQSECKYNLKAAYTGQRALFAEKDTYGTTATEIGFSPERNNRYAYYLGGDETIEAQLSTTPSGALRGALSGRLQEELGVQGSCPRDCNVTMACAGNLDNDGTIDVWSISSADRTIKGEQVPAGMPYNEVNDVTD
jgi:type II secretory pathway pseudopilin PulG